MSNPGQLRDGLAQAQLTSKIDVLIQLDYTHREIATLLKEPIHNIHDTAIRNNLRYEPEMEFSEIAKVLQIDVQLVRIAYRSALEKLREIIGDDTALDEFFHQHLEEFDTPHLPPDQEYFI